MLAAGVECDLYGEGSAGRNGLFVKFERRASAAGPVGGDDDGLFGPVLDPEAGQGDFAGSEMPEPDGIRPSVPKNGVRECDDAARRGQLPGCGPGLAGGESRDDGREEHSAEEVSGGEHRACQESDKSPPGFFDASLFGERGDDLVEDSVDEGAASGRGVVLRDFDPLVEGHLDGDRGEGGELGHGGSDDEVVHEDDALDIPVSGEFLDVVLIGVVVDKCLFEERLDEFGILLALELRGDADFGVGGAESGEGAEDHDDDVGEVVGPEHGDLFEDIVEAFGVLELLEEVFEQSFVVVEGSFLAEHVLLVVIAFDELGVERPDDFGVFAPTEFPCCDSVVYGVGVCDGPDDGVVDEFGVRVEVFECGQFLLFCDFLPLFGVTGDLDGEHQNLEIEIVGLVDGGHECFFRRHHVVGSGLDVCEERLDDLDAE